MQREAKQRARSLASVLSEKSKGQREAAMDTDRLSPSSIEASLPDDVVHFTTTRVPLNKRAAVSSVEIPEESIASEEQPPERSMSLLPEETKKNYRKCGLNCSLCEIC